MALPILAAKTYIPQHRSKLVLRPRLAGRLNEGLSAGHPLTLVSAPAGFGKTTLVSQWTADCGWPVAWLSLDETDNELARFLTYLITALQTLEPQVGKKTLGQLQGAQPGPTEGVLTGLLNELTSIPNPVLLVLDDYHLIEALPVEQAVEFLLDHLPPNLRLVILTREDPPLPLARLRARGQLTELRAAELRFTPAEAADFFNRVMGLDLDGKDVAALERRTEGWIAGLQLAALALQGAQTDPGWQDFSGFIQAFTGSHRFVLDYLMEEVLQRQPETVRSFLMETAILERLCEPLCNRVTGREDGQAMLESLERGNLFLVPLDDQRLWYRFHHLFGEALRARLAREQPGLVHNLHRRASAWYGQNNFPSEAIHHSLAGQDFEQAARLIELAWSGMDISYQSAAWLAWVNALPDPLVRARPVLSLGYAWALLDGGELEQCEERLRDAERWLENPTGEAAFVDEALIRSLPAAIASARAYRALALGDVPGAVRHARLALDLAPEEDHIRYIQATALLGLTLYANGDLEAAERFLVEFQDSLWSAGDAPTAMGIAYVLANIRVDRGQLHSAERAYRQALRFAAGQGETLPVGAADLYRGLAELDLERGDLEATAQSLETARKLGEQAALIDWPYRLNLAEARFQEAQGNLAGALGLLEEAERLHVRSPMPDVHPVAALKARIWIRQGRLAEAQEWVRQRGLSSNDTLNYLGEFEHITLARLLAAMAKSREPGGSYDEALGLLERLRQAAEAGGRLGSLIEILILQALTEESRGNPSQALAPLEQALDLAKAEGYQRVFIDEGPGMAKLLARIEETGAAPHLNGFIRALLDVFSRQDRGQPASPGGQSSAGMALVEPLSPRELDVLRLLRCELNGPEIAAQMMVSLNTFHTHTKNIYAKLGVNTRRAAVRRAEELELF